MDFLRVSTASQEQFQKMAECLMNDYVICKGNELYRMMEIEFYWHDENHQDKSVYKRNHIDPLHGAWFFHFSGVDIALKNSSGGYGGVLIRSILNISDSELKVHKGPMVCAMILFSGIDAFNSTKLMPYITKHSMPAFTLKSTKRVGLGKNAEEGGFRHAEYRFVAQTRN